MPGAEDRGHAALLESGHVVVRDNSAGRDEDVRHPTVAQEGADAGHERHVRAGQDRQTDDVDVFLERRRHDHLRRLAQPGVDDFEAFVAQTACEHFLPRDRAHPAPAWR